MIRITKDQNGRVPNFVVIVAFNPANGQVYGTFGHGSYGEDAEGVARSRERLLKEMRADLGARAKIEIIELASGKMPVGSIKRVDLKTRSLVTDRLDRNAIARIPTREKRSTARAPKLKRSSKRR